MVHEILIPWPQELFGKWVPVISKAIHEKPFGRYDVAAPIIEKMGITCFDDEEHFNLFVEEENLKRSGRGQTKLYYDKVVKITAEYPKLEIRVYVCGRNKNEIAENLPRVKMENPD